MSGYHREKPYNPAPPPDRVRNLWMSLTHHSVQ